MLNGGEAREGKIVIRDGDNARQEDNSAISSPFRGKDWVMLKHLEAVISRVFPACTPLLHGLAITSVAAILCAPCLLIGIPAGSDAPIHEIYQYHFSNQFWNGDFYPRWLAEANKGYGSPVFLIQYPLPYFMTALLRPITQFPSTATREAHELGVYCFLVFAAAGLTARAWFRNRCSPVASTVAAAVYMSLPYILGQGLYGRLALGELTAFVWMPLALALCDRAEWRRFGVVSAMGTVFALLLLSNFLCGILFIPVMFLYAMASGTLANTSSIERLVPVIFALVVGIGVAAIYVFPLLVYQHLFDINMIPAHHPEGEFGRYFLMASLSDISNNRIFFPGMVMALGLTFFVARYVWRANIGFAIRIVLLVSFGLGVLMIIPDWGPRLIEASGIKTSGFTSFGAYSMRMLFTSLFTLALGILAYCRVSKSNNEGPECSLLLASCGVFVLMLPWSAVIWRAIPQLAAAIQFPWRLCGILTVTVTGLFAAAMDDCLHHRVGNEGAPSPIVIALVVVAIIGGGTLIWRVDTRFRNFDTLPVDVTRNVDFMYPSYVAATRLARFAKILGTSPDSFVVAPTAVEEGIRAEVSSGQCSASVIRLQARRLHVSARCETDALLQIGQLYWPLWRIVPISQYPLGEALGSSAEGLIEMSLASGQHDFELVYDGGSAERYGATVTLLSLLLVAGASVFAGLSKWGAFRRKASHKPISAHR
jgi:hypothetical protein